MKNYREITDELLQRRDEQLKKSAKTKKIIGICAFSGTALTLAAVVGINSVTKTKAPVYQTQAETETFRYLLETVHGKAKTKLITAFDSENGENGENDVMHEYMIPANGQWLCRFDYEELKEKYAGQDVEFAFAISFWHGQQLSENEDEEFERLENAGFKLVPVEHWVYTTDDSCDDEGKTVFQTKVIILTLEELENFVPDEDTGYGFYFLRNGDSSPVQIDGGDYVIPERSFSKLA